MHKPINILILLVLTFITTSCTDTPEKLIKDDIRHMESIIAILDKRETGELSEAQAVSDLEALAERGEKLHQRYEELKEQKVTQEAYMVDQHYASEIAKVDKRYNDIWIKLQSKNELTPALYSAVSKAFVSNSRFFYINLLPPI